MAYAVSKRIAIYVRHTEHIEATAPLIGGVYMIVRIKKLEPLKDYKLYVLFDDGRSVIYDLTDDINTLPGYSDLKTITGLFKHVQLDESRTCIFWNDYIDLPSDILYEYGEECKTA